MSALTYAVNSSVNPTKMVKNKLSKKSAGSFCESDLLKAKENDIIPCKISSWSCIYHACMSDDCQKRFMMDDGGYGKGHCEKA